MASKPKAIDPKISGRLPGAAAIVREFAEAAQFQVRRDIKLWRAVDRLLTELGADALVFRGGLDGEPLAVFKSYTQLGRAQKQQIIERVAHLAEMDQLVGHAGKMFRDSEFELDILFCQPDFGFVTETGVASKPPQRPFFAFLRMTARRGSHGAALWAKMTTVSAGEPGFDSGRLEYFETFCRTVQLAFARRAESDSIFSNRLSERFWNAVDDELGDSETLRPWEAGANLRVPRIATATLSFDIRKSTFIMENAIEGGAYADWIDGLIVLLKRVIHIHNGIFDKFTGDGALAHFTPVSVFDTVAGHEPGTRQAIASAALACSWDLLRAFDIYSGFLLPNLAIVKRDFGAAVGLAFDQAYWSVDRSGAPIVVGRGVVHACRASAGERGTVQATNGFFQAAAHLYSEVAQWDTAEFVTKEYPPGSGVLLYRFLHAPERLGCSNEQIWALCLEVRAEIAARRGPQDIFDLTPTKDL